MTANPAFAIMQTVTEDERDLIQTVLYDAEGDVVAQLCIGAASKVMKEHREQLRRAYPALLLLYIRRRDVAGKAEWQVVERQAIASRQETQEQAVKAAKLIARLRRDSHCGNNQTVEKQ